MTPFKKAVAALAISVGTVISTPASAKVLLVHDPKAIAELISLLNTGLDQLDQLKETHGAVTGGRPDIADLFGENVDPQRIANSLTDLLGGNAVNAQVGSRISELRSNLSVMTGAEYYGGDGSDVRSQMYDLVNGTSLASMAVNEENFAGAGRAITRYDTYRKEIGKTADLKASVDLNTRVQIENGQTLAMILQTLTSQGQVTAAQITAGVRSTELSKRKSGTIEGVVDVE